MLSLTLAHGRPTLADSMFSRSLASDLVLVAVGTALTALCAQLVIPLWPVPLTMQTFAVLVVGTVLGPLRGALSMALYLLLGVLGLPVFANGTSGDLTTLPTGGYLLGFVFAAPLVGWLAQREWDRRWLGTTLSFIAGSVVVYAFGLPWLHTSLDARGAALWHDQMGYATLLEATFAAGMMPFLLGDLLKAVLAGALIPRAWRPVAPSPE